MKLIIDKLSEKKLVIDFADTNISDNLKPFGKTNLYVMFQLIKFKNE